MKRLSCILGLLLVCVCLPLHAKGDRNHFSVFDFSKGLDSYHNSFSIPDGTVQDCDNVFFDATSPVSKRMGYTVVWSSKQYSGQQIWTYVDKSNTAWQLLRTSDSILASNLINPPVLVSTIAVNDLIGETNAFGNAYFVDNSQGVYYWNSSSITYVSGSPKGSLINSFHNRVWVSGAAIPNGNQLYGSKYYDGTVWATGVNPTDPVQYSIGLQDNFDNVTALYVYLDTEYIFKHFAIYALYGFDQTSFQISQLTQECGCIDMNTIQTFNGAVEFMSMRGVESFNGYTCKRISDPVKNKVDPATLNSFNGQGWIQQTSADWDAGTVSSTTISNNLVFVSTDNVNLPNNSFESGLTNWTASGTGYSFINGSAQTVNCGSIGAYDGSQMADFVYNGAGGFTMHAKLVDVKSGNTVSDNGYAFASSECTWLPGQIPAGGVIGNLVQVHFSDDKSQGEIFSDPFINSGQAINFRYFSDNNLGTGKPTFYWDFLQGGRSDILQGTFLSQIHNLGSITSFSNFAVTDTVLNGSSIGFTLCTSSMSNMIPQTCAVQTANAQIVVATNTYIQVLSTFTLASSSASSTSDAQLQNFTVNWFSGTRLAPMASTVWDNRYWLALSTTSSDSFNDAVLVLNKTGIWTVLNIHAGGFTQYKNSLYHSDSLGSGNVYLDNSGYADNGKPINAYVKTKDLSLGDLSSNDYLYVLYPSILNNGACAVTFQYDMDHSGNYFSMGSPLETEFSNFSSVRLPFPIDSSHQDFGQSVNFLIGTNDGSCPFNLIGFEGLYKARPIQ